MNWREFLSLSVLAGTSLASLPAPSCAEPQNRPGSFNFIFFTDTHIQPELDASSGCAMCFKKIRSSLKGDFAIQGGDHVFDALGVDCQRAKSLYELYSRTEQDLGLKVYHVMGNHDPGGVHTESGISTADPEFGKQIFQERFGQTYYSFDHKGHHFVILDSIQLTASREWEATIDAEQLDWLRKDLDNLPQGTPIVVTVHVPLISGAASYLAPRLGKNLVVGDAPEVVSLLEGHNVLAVFQGHLHVNEVDRFKEIPFVTCGAVSGNWWHGTHEGTPEGFTVVTLRNGEIS